MPNPQIRYPNAVFGYSANSPALYGDAVSYFVASATVAAGAAVILDTSNAAQIKTATAAVIQPGCVGIAAEAGVALDVVAVTTTGFTTALNNTGWTIGDRVGPDATTAGNLATVTAATAVTQAKDVGNVVAIACATITAGIASGLVYVKIV